MTQIDNGRFVDLYIYDPIDGAIRIDQGQGEITPDITVAVESIPRLIEELQKILDQNKEVKE